MFGLHSENEGGRGGGGQMQSFITECRLGIDSVLCINRYACRVPQTGFTLSEGAVPNFFIRYTKKKESMDCTG